MLRVVVTLGGDHRYMLTSWQGTSTACSVGSNACGQSILKVLRDSLAEAGKRWFSGGCFTKTSYKNKQVYATER